MRRAIATAPARARIPTPGPFGGMPCATAHVVLASQAVVPVSLLVVAVPLLAGVARCVARRPADASGSPRAAPSPPGEQWT